MLRIVVHRCQKLSRYFYCILSKLVGHDECANNPPLTLASFATEHAATCPVDFRYSCPFFQNILVFH